MYHDPTHSLIWVHLDSSLCYYSWYCIDSHCTGLCAYILERSKLLTSCCCCWVAQLCPTLCNPMGCSTPGLPVLHHHPKFAQVHLHCISDAIQPAHPLTLSSPSALNLSQHQGLFQLVSCLHQVTKILALQLPSNESSGLTSLKTGWFDLFAVQGALRSLLQHHSWLQLTSLKTGWFDLFAVQGALGSLLQHHSWLQLTSLKTGWFDLSAVQGALGSLLQHHSCCCCCQVASGVSDSVWPHGRQPTRLPHPWDSPGKNTAMGCHLLLQCMKVRRHQIFGVPPSLQSSSHNRTWPLGSP